MNANATLAAIAIRIVMVNAVVKRGEKVLNAYMIVSIRFNCWLLLLLARLFSFCSSVVNRNEWGNCLIALCLHYRRKKERCQVFFNFFFVGCGRVGVGAWVWARGCGWGWRDGGAWVGRWGGGMGMGGRGMRRAGLGLSLSDGRESPPCAYPTRIRIAGSCVIDRPTFRLPGSQMRAWNFIQTHPALPTRWQECL